VTGVGDRDATGGEQEDALADALLMSVDGEGASRDEIDRALSLIRFHHREIEDDGLALAQGLDGAGHFIEAARLHQIHLRSGGADARHADHIGSGQAVAEIEGVAVGNGRQRTPIGMGGPLVLLLLLVFVDKIVKIAIEIVVSGDDGT
jgi:hypothetical protein